MQEQKCVSAPGLPQAETQTDRDGRGEREREDKTDEKRKIEDILLAEVRCHCV